MKASDYLYDWITNVTNGWMVNFEEDASSGLKNQLISVHPSKLIVGFSFGNNGSGKTIFVWPNEVEIAWEKLKEDGIVPRGVMFWNAKLDQMNVFNGTKRENYTLAGGFNEFLKVR